MKTLPRGVVIDALALFGFEESLTRDTHTVLWGMRQDGTDVVIRIPGFALIPPATQRTFINQAQISPEQWRFAVDRILAQTPTLPPKKKP